MNSRVFRWKQIATAVGVAFTGLLSTQIADAGPGIAPVYSAAAKPPPAAPDTFAQTFYANSPLGLRPDLVAGPLDATGVNGTYIDTGTAMRKFVDILPGIPGLAPTTNIGTGVIGSSAKYIPVAVPRVWTADGADYYHLAAVEYTEQMHSDLPKATTLRGYVQIEEPGEATPAGSKHIQLFYPDGTTPMYLPDASGTLQPVYGYDHPHYMGPTIVATKDKAVRVKYSNLLPPGGYGTATTLHGDTITGRNGDLPIPVDETLPSGSFLQNRIDVHLHGGFTPWISDGTPHQWTIPVGEKRYGYLSDIAVTAVGTGYTAPTLLIDPPQSVATATATILGGSVSALNLTNAGANYTAGTATVSISPPPNVGVQGPAATATSAIGLGKLTAITSVNGSTGYVTAPAVTVSAPTTSVNAVATSTLSAAASPTAGYTVTGLVLGTATPNVGYATAPAVTIAAPNPAIPATAVLAASATNGALSLTTNTSFGYWSAPAAPVLAAPPAAVNATGTAAIAPNAANGKSPQVTAIAVNATNFGYWPANTPTVTLAAPATQVAATTTGATGFSAANNGAATLGNLRISNGNGNFGYWNNAASNVAGSLISVSAPPPVVPAVVTATIGANGSVTNISVNANNWGYNDNQNNITLPAFPAPAGKANAALGAVTLTAGKPAVTVTAGGAGYTTAPTVTVTGGTFTGTGTVTATATLTGGVVTGVAINVGNRVYTRAPTVTIGRSYTPATLVNNGNSNGTLTVSVGGNTAVNLGNAGAGYVPNSTITVTVPSNTPSVQAVVTPTIGTGANAGRITGLTLSNAGSGYGSAPVITIAAPVTSATATAVPTLTAGKITAFTITGGANYTAAPAVTISTAAAGQQATLTAAVNGSGALVYTLSNPGLGYAVAPTVVVPAPTASVTAAATATINGTGNVTGFTVTNAGTNYLPGAAPLVTVAAAPLAAQATATASINAAGTVTGYTITSAGYGYWTAPTITDALPTLPVAATAVANVGPNGAVGGFTITNPGAGYVTAPTVTLGWPAGAVQATGTVTAAGGALTTAAITNAGGGYTATPNVQIVDATGTGGTVNALAVPATGPAFQQVPDMTGPATIKDVGGTTTVPYVAPIVGEGTLYYTNNQSERLMWYHDHTAGITRLNVYEGMAAPFLLTDPAVDPVLPGQTAGTAAFQGYIPEEQIPIVIQERTFVPKDIAQQDVNWDQTHWGQYGDLWFPHVYETNQNPSFFHSLSNLGRWDWGPWFAIVYPALYALPSGKYGDVTTTPEAYQDTMMVNGAAFPTVTVEPRAYRFRILNAANDRFMNLGFYLADPAQVAADGRTNVEVKTVANTGAQPGTIAGGAANVFQSVANASFLPWPTDGRIAPSPDVMGPPMIQIGNEGGVLPQWVQHDPVPVNYDYNRRSVTVLNVSQNNDFTQACYPECHGLYLGPAERADVVVDFAPYAGKTLILYNDAPAPNPAYDTRIDYYTGNDPTNLVNYMTGGAPNTQIGYGPNTRTVMQVVVGTTQSTPVDYVNATGPAIAGNVTWDPTKLGAGRVLSALTSTTPGVIQTTYAATQAPPIVGESAYNIAFNNGYTDQYGNMYLASQNQPEFYVTNPGKLQITNIVLTGQTTATGAASGVGLGVSSTGTNPNAGSGTGYSVPPAVIISPPTACTIPGTQTLPCVAATATATVSGGQVTGVTLVNPGAGYTEVPQVTFVSGGTIMATSVTNAGSGYSATNPPLVTVTGGGGSGAVITANVSAAGTITGLTVVNAGLGYSTSPTVTIAPPSPVVAAVAGTPTLLTLPGSLDPTIPVTSGGSGYLTAPTVTLGAPPAVTAPLLGTPVVTNGVVTSIPITSGGANFASAPLVSISAPTQGATASATATVDPTGVLCAAGTVCSVTVASGAGGSGYSTVPGVVFSAAPAAGVAASVTPVFLPVGANTYVVGFNIVNAGSGYTAAPVISMGVAPGCTAGATTTLNATGGIASVTMSDIGINGGCAVGQTASVTGTLTAAGTTATGTAVMDATGTTVASVTITNAGSGYTTAPTISFAAPTGTPATAVAQITGGVLTGFTITGGSGYTTAPTVALSGGGGTQAYASATVAGGAVTAITVTTPGTGYTAAPSVTLTGGAGGTQATATAAAAGGGYGATAIAIATTTQAFVAPAAIPGNQVPTTPNAVPLTLSAGLSNLLGCNNGALPCTNLGGAVIGRLMNPAIQELFEPFYGRMNATFGIEMPNQSLTVQTTLPLNYVDAATEMWEYNKPVMWKITHNGVDAHPVHFHLVNVQVVNRVGWDGTVKAPEDDEIGWKEVVKMNPLEDIIVVMTPTMPHTPFGLDKSVRAQDPSQPLGVNMGFTQFTTQGINGAIGNQLANEYKGAPSAGYLGGALGVGEPATVVNSLENFDNEYVWHCHILGHEENDFMRPISVISSPVAPAPTTGLVATQAAAGQPVVLTWTDPTPIALLGSATNNLGNLQNELGFLVQRSASPAGPWTTVATAAANATTAQDLLLSPLASGSTAYYQVVGYNAAGSSVGNTVLAVTAK